jgi:hypothetical protein
MTWREKIGEVLYKSDGVVFKVTISHEKIGI